MCSNEFGNICERVWVENAIQSVAETKSGETLRVELLCRDKMWKNIPNHWKRIVKQTFTLQCHKSAGVEYTLFQTTYADKT